MNKIAAAADNLLKKGKITKEEHELLKEASKGSIVKPLLGAAQGPIQMGVMGLFGASLLGQLLRPLIESAKSNISYGKMIEKTPQLQDKDPEQVSDYFNVIKTFSPKAASNPLVAGALVNKMMEFGGIDHKLVQDIASIESGIQRQDPLSALSSAAAKSVMTPIEESAPTGFLGGIKSNLSYRFGENGGLTLGGGFEP